MNIINTATKGKAVKVVTKPGKLTIVAIASITTGAHDAHVYMTPTQLRSLSRKLAKAANQGEKESE
jgi:hypothetical protein